MKAFFASCCQLFYCRILNLIFRRKLGSKMILGKMTKRYIILQVSALSKGMNSCKTLKITVRYDDFTKRMRR